MPKRNATILKNIDQLAKKANSDNYRLTEGLAILVIRKYIIGAESVLAYCEATKTACQEVSAYENGLGEIVLAYKLRLCASLNIDMFKFNMIFAHLTKLIGNDLERIEGLKAYYQKNVKYDGVEDFEADVDELMDVLDYYA